MTENYSLRAIERMPRAQSGVTLGRWDQASNDSTRHARPDCTLQTHQRVGYHPCDGKPGNLHSPPRTHHSTRKYIPLWPDRTVAVASNSGVTGTGSCFAAQHGKSGVFGCTCCVTLWLTLPSMPDTLLKKAPGTEYIAVNHYGLTNMSCNAAEGLRIVSI